MTQKSTVSARVPRVHHTTVVRFLPRLAARVLGGEHVLSDLTRLPARSARFARPDRYVDPAHTQNPFFFFWYHFQYFPPVVFFDLVFIYFCCVTTVTMPSRFPRVTGTLPSGLFLSARAWVRRKEIWQKAASWGCAN